MYNSYFYFRKNLITLEQFIFCKEYNNNIIQKKNNKKKILLFILLNHLKKFD